MAFFLGRTNLRWRIGHVLQFGIEGENELWKRETLSRVSLGVHDEEKAGGKFFSRPGRLPGASRFEGRDGVGVISGTSEISHDGSPLYFAPMIIIFHPRRDSGTPGQVTLLTDSVLFV